jgi:acyl-CoA synthetase (AMP-forming)/AMP-acid ligase II
MEAAVIGIPSAEWGEDIVAVVVLRPGERATAEELVLRSRYATPAT